MIEKIFEIIKWKIEKAENNLPCLFLWDNLEITNSEVKNYSLKLLKDFDIPKEYLYILKDNQENIKIQELKEFINFSNSKPWFTFQIFFIENISRLTLTSANSLLKFFEEPGKHNIIFLTSKWENWIIDTILSRTRIINLWWGKKDKKDEFFYSLIKNYKEKNSNDIFSYFFKSKLEKEEYISFLDNLIIYQKDSLSNWKQVFNKNFPEEIQDDINAIKQNNVNAKYIIDKWLIKI